MLAVLALEPGTSTTSGRDVSPNVCVAPMTNTPLSVTMGPTSCQTKRSSTPGSP
jgi:hypothetical protein